MAPIAFNPPLLLRSRLPALGGYAVVRVVLGLLLLAAAGLKTHQLVTQPPIGAGLLDSRWLLAGVVEFELFFGLWLLAGLYPQSTRRAAIVCFAIFGCVALYEALSGTPSCGCFGVVPVNPWHTLILDAAAVGALIGFRPAPGSAWPLRQTVSCGARTTERRRIGWLAVSWIALAVPAGLAIATHRVATLDESGEVDGGGSFVLLQPETWIGKPFPLLRYIDIGDRLATGQWLLVLYRHHCPHCQAVLRACSELRAEPRLADDSRRVALIEIPPHALSSRKAADDADCLVGRLEASRTWFLESPTLVRLSHGRVTAAAVRASVDDLVKFRGLGSSEFSASCTPAQKGLP